MPKDEWRGIPSDALLMKQRCYGTHDEEARALPKVLPALTPKIGAAAPLVTSMETQTAPAAPEAPRAAPSHGAAPRRVGRGRRFVTTMKTDQDAALVPPGGKGGAPAHVKSVDEQRKENKEKRQRLAGTNWSFGNEVEMADWRRELGKGTVLKNSMEESAMLQNEVTAQPGHKSIGEQRIENKEKRKQLSGTQWAYGAGKRDYGEDAAGGVERYTQEHKNMWTIAGGVERGLTKQQMFDMKVRFKYGSEPLWDTDVPTEFDTDTKRAGRMLLKELAARPMASEKERFAAARALKKSMQQSTIFDGQPPPGPLYNKRVDEHKFLDSHTPLSGVDLETQRKQNKEKRQRLAGTQWSFGEGGNTYTRASDMPVYHTGGYAERVSAERANAKALRQALQKTQITIGDDEEYC